MRPSFASNVSIRIGFQSTSFLQSRRTATVLSPAKVRRARLFGQRCNPVSSSLAQPAENGIAPTVSLPTSEADRKLSAFRDILSGVGELARPLWRGNRRLVAWLWTSASLLFAFATTLYAAALSLLQRMFWNALSTKDVVKFQKLLVLYVIVVVVGPIVLSLFDWIKERLALLWRKALTQQFLGQYLDNSTHYRLTLRGQVVDNPDQRIAEDIRQFTSRAVRFFCVIFVGVFDLAVFSILLYKVYSPLLWVVMLYAVFGTSAIAVFGRRLVPLNRLQLSREADFRYSLVRIRESSESIAFYGGEKAEGRQLDLRFDALFRNALKVLGLTRDVNFVSHSYRYWAQVIPTGVVAPAYFRGDMPLGGISQMFFSFNHVLSSMSLVVMEFTALAEFSAGVRRLRQLSRAMHEENAVPFDHSSKILQSYDTPGTVDAEMRLSKVSLRTPSDPPRDLVQNLSMHVSTGQHVLIVGTSGVGKSSLLRAVCGLWNDGSGSVELPKREDTLFLPQKPFISLGSLRENVTYPNTGVDVEDAEIERILAAVNLGNISSRMGGLDARGEQLGRRMSLGEQQRLAFARVLFSKPKFLIGDEFTSALDLENERLLYGLLKELNMTVVSVGNRPTLLDFHDVVLHLKENGGWELETPESTANRLSVQLKSTFR